MSKEQDEFRRMELVAMIERSEEIIGRYYVGISEYVEIIRKSAHEIGVLDERLSR